MERTSKLIKAMQGWSTALQSYSDPPKGVFGRKAIVTTWAVTLNSDEIDFEFEVVKDTDLEANESELRIYNLSSKTIQNLIVGKEITITAGYKGDTGVICKGNISKVKTKREGVDKITTVYILDNMGIKERDLVDVTYSKGMTASYILKDLIGRTHLPVATFNPVRNHTYEDEVTINGGLLDNIQHYSEVCGINTWINNGKVYSTKLSNCPSGYFNLNENTGLIDSPDSSEETTEAEDYKDTITVITAKSLLQHRLNVGSVVNLKSLNFSGKYRVRKVNHVFNPDEAVTEVELV